MRPISCVLSCLSERSGSELATAEQCRRLVVLISSLQAQQAVATECTSSGISLQDVLYRTLHNAAFCEMHHIRGDCKKHSTSSLASTYGLFPDALTAHLNDQTEAIYQSDVDQVQSVNISDDLNSSIISTFGLLMSIRLEYLSRKSRSDLLRRAHAIDVALSVGVGRPEIVNVLTLLREFSRRMCTFTGSVEQVSVV